ncbi:filamentous hemagglutinin N-terminal domain-containing protein [uncultured Succinatimonas sp.]|uniref:filamentous hemagglutinin N-terminal domain-containing protein n=1 Tax=uncultured Succinatimonas sp. TaxID=1262973 RepID=UPI0025DB05D3|nr:filamentous hemagglutinin N-terminal domain-containing protein [uncultured Succinatimonas sp.]
MKNLNKFISAFLLIPSFSFAATLPQGGEFIKGNGSIAYQGNNTLNISSQDLNNVIKWNGFDIGKDGNVNFDKNNYLNLVKSSQSTLIEGNLSGGGKVFIVNPNGVTLASGSNVSVPTFGVSTAKFNDKMIENFTQNGVIEITGKGMGKVTALSTINTNNLIIDGGQIIIKAAEDIKNFAGSQRLQHLVNSNEIKLKSSTKRIDIGAKTKLNLEKDFNLSKEEGLIDHSGEIAISTADEFKKIFEDLNGDYWLTNDIKLENLEYPISAANQFEGNLDGAFNKLSYNISYNYDQNLFQYPNLGLFAELDNAIVKNLKISDSSIHVSGNNISKNIGALAGIINNSTLENISVENFKVSFDNPSYLNNTINVGALAGSAEGNNKFTNIISSFAKDTELLLNKENLYLGSVLGSASGSIDTYGLVSGNSYNSDLKIAAIGKNDSDTSIASTISEGIKNAEEKSTDKDIMLDAFVINKDKTSAELSGFLTPYFVEDYIIEYDGKNHTYQDLASAPGFNAGNYIEANHSNIKNVGSYDIDLSADTDKFYFISDNGQKSFTATAKVTVTPKDLGEIVIGDITLGQGADFNLSPGEIISNLDKLPLCEGDSIDDLNLGVKITKSPEKPNFYYITLEPKEGSSSNYTYTIKGGTLTTDFPITDPIDPDTDIDPDFSVVTQTPLEPAKRHPNFKKALSDSRCDYCTKRGEIFKKNLNKKGELKFDNAVQGLNVEKSRKEIAEFKDF